MLQKANWTTLHYILKDTDIALKLQLFGKKNINLRAL